MTKQTTVVVIGSLRVNANYLVRKWVLLEELSLFPGEIHLYHKYLLCNLLNSYTESSKIILIRGTWKLRKKIWIVFTD